MTADLPYADDSASMDDSLTPADDGLHDAGDDFYGTETFWFSFFVPERRIGAWLYTTIRRAAGICGGGLWIWDDAGAAPWDLPFYEQFSWLRPPADTGPEKLAFPTGMTVAVREPLMSYDLGYDDRNRCRVDLRFDAVEPPVPLRSGAPPYPRAHHFDQIGRLTGAVTLDGERIAVDCHGMRDRSWGRRTERHYSRIGYTWAGDAGTSLLAYSRPTGAGDDVYTGYLRRGSDLGKLVAGRRRVVRDPGHAWVTSMELEIEDESGRALAATGEAVSRMILPGATSVCVNTLMRWAIGGQTIWGEDQDVWPLDEFRAARGLDHAPA